MDHPPPPPAGQLAFRERFGEAVIDDDPIPQRAEPAHAPRTDETRHRTAVTSDHNETARVIICV